MSNKCSNCKSDDGIYFNWNANTIHCASCGIQVGRLATDMSAGEPAPASDDAAAELAAVRAERRLLAEVVAEIAMGDDLQLEQDDWVKVQRLVRSVVDDEHNEEGATIAKRTATVPVVELVNGVFWCPYCYVTNGHAADCPAATAAPAGDALADVRREERHFFMLMKEENYRLHDRLKEVEAVIGGVPDGMTLGDAVSLRISQVEGTEYVEECEREVERLRMALADVQGRLRKRREEDGDALAGEARESLSLVWQMMGALSFAKSVIKSGEPWTKDCEFTINGAIADANKYVAARKLQERGDE